MEAHAHAPESPRPLKVLFVCTGNQCRSPFAQRLMETHAAGAGASVEVESAGLLEVDGAHSPGRMVDVARSQGVDLADHTARALRHLDCSGYDLVVGFERSHIATAVVDGGARPDRAFLLTELVRLLDGLDAPGSDDPTERARALIAAAHAARGQGGGFIPGEEMDDPIGKSTADYQRVTSEVGELVDALWAALFNRS